MTRRRLTPLPPFLGLAPVVLSAAVLAGCASSDSIESTEPDPTPATTVSTTTTTTTSSVVTTTVADTTTSAPTTVASTSSVAATTVPDTTAAPTSAGSATVADLLPGPAPTPPTRAYVTGERSLLEVDPTTGTVVRTVVEDFVGDGVFRGRLRLSPDGGVLWFAEGYEDGWYGCETSVGSFGRVDLATGALEVVGRGVAPQPSPDGARVATVDSGVCLPDPEAPDIWVLTPYDRVVVRDLTTGDEQAIVSEPEPADLDAPNQVDWAGFASDGSLLVLTIDGQLRRVDLAGSGTLQDHPVIVDDLLGSPIGVTGDVLITVDDGLEGSTDVYAVELATGATAKLAGSDRYLAVGVSADGAIVVSGIAEVTVEPDAPVTVLVAPEDAPYTDVDW